MSESCQTITVNGGETNNEYAVCDRCGSTNIIQYTHQTDEITNSWMACSDCGSRTSVVAWDELESLSLTIVDTEGE